VLGVPVNDRFQIITEDAPDDLVIDRSYLGITRTDDCVIIEVTRTPARR
jgi:4-oxalocrotonate tautomerase